MSAPQLGTMRVTTPSAPDSKRPGLPGVDRWLPVVLEVLAAAIAGVKCVTLLTLHGRTREIERVT